MMKKASEKRTKNSGFSNVVYMIRLMFKISPLFVIGEILMHIMINLPARIVSVIGLKFVIDEVQNGGDTKKIILGISLMLGVLVIGEVSNALFAELFAAREKEKLDLGIQ